jgi:hypothetical protein
MGISWWLGMQKFFVYTCIAMQEKSCHYPDSEGGSHICVWERETEEETDPERRRERVREEGVQEDPGKQFDMSIMVVRSDLNILHETWSGKSGKFQEVGTRVYLTWDMIGKNWKIPGGRYTGGTCVGRFLYLMCVGVVKKKIDRRKHRIYSLTHQWVCVSSFLKISHTYLRKTSFLKNSVSPFWPEFICFLLIWKKW